MRECVQQASFAPGPFHSCHRQHVLVPTAELELPADDQALCGRTRSAALRAALLEFVGCARHNLRRKVPRVVRCTESCVWRLAARRCVSGNSTTGLDSVPLPLNFGFSCNLPSIQPCVESFSCYLLGCAKQRCENFVFCFGRTLGRRSLAASAPNLPSAGSWAPHKEKLAI